MQFDKASPPHRGTHFSFSRPHSKGSARFDSAPPVGTQHWQIAAKERPAGDCWTVLASVCQCRSHLPVQASPGGLGIQATPLRRPASTTQFRLPAKSQNGSARIFTQDEQVALCPPRWARAYPLAPGRPALAPAVLDLGPRTFDMGMAPCESVPTSVDGGLSDCRARLAD